MTDLEEALVTHLETLAPLGVLIGAGDAMRLYPLVLPNGPTYPAVTYRRIDGERFSALASDTGLAHPTLELDSWAKTYEGARAVAAELMTALKRQSWTAAGINVRDALLVGDEDLVEDDVTDAGRTVVFRVITAFEFIHYES